MTKILIIEDESAIRRVLSKILQEESKEYEVFEASDGIEGLEKLKKDDYDLVLCDIKMPKMDGLEVLTEAKKINPEVPFVMISGHGDLYFEAARSKSSAQHSAQCPRQTKVGGREQTSEEKSEQAL